MRVLFCSDTYPPQVNGVSVVTAISVRGLLARNWECAVITPQYPTSLENPFAHEGLGGDEIALSIPSIAMPTYPDIRLAAPDYRGVLDVVQQFKPDLIHAETEFVIGRMGQLAASARGIPLVTSYHTDFSKYVSAYGIPALRSAVAAYIARFHRRALRTYTPSGPARDDLRAMGVSEVEVWGRGVDITTFHASHRSLEMRRSLGIQDDDLLFVHVGRLAKEKSVHVILDAYRIAQAQLPGRGMHLVIAGAGPCESALRASAPPRTTFLGHLDRARALPMLYASSDVFLFSSLTETLGLVVLEAMASGLPVIAAPAGGVADHLRHEENGLAYPNADAAAMAAAMIRLASDPSLHQRLMHNARHTAEALTWEAELDRLDESYRDVIFGATSRRGTVRYQHPTLAPVGTL
jgi:glycosyltransferase involved in cell wall biosynthesis